MTLTAAPPRTIAQRAAYAHCRDVARARARNFYYGLKLTPEPARSAVYAIYAWMRTGDDLVDEGGSVSEKRSRLDRFAKETERALTGGTAAPVQVAGEAADTARRAVPPGTVGSPEMWAAFAETVRRFHVERSDIDSMLVGLGEDIDPQGYDTHEELVRYCSGVASSVGRVCITIWGVREGAMMPRAIDLANRRGVAFQLTNMLRDFAEDFDEGRVYLPRESFRRAGLTTEDVRMWNRPEDCERFVSEQASIARAEFEASSKLESMVNPSCAPTLWAMTTIYSGLLKKIEDRPCRIVGETRIRLQSFHKAGIAMRALARSRRGVW